MNIRFNVLLLISLLVALILSTTTSNTSILLGTPKICVDPAVTTNYIGFIFPVSINITDITNMWSWNVTLYYNKTLLYCSYAFRFGAPSWSSWTAIGPTIEQNYNATHGRVRAYMSATSGSVFNGSMTIATVYFNVTAATGSCALDIKDSVIKDKNGSLIAHDEYDGTFQTGQYTKVVFRFLGVESGYNENFRASQQLIQNLTRFLNWQNTTWGKYNYTSYIHLLSNASNAQDLPYYVGQPTKANVISEIQTFLAVTGQGENNSLTVRIFQFVDHGGKTLTSINHQPTWIPGLQLDAYWVPSDGHNPGFVDYECLCDSKLNETLNSVDLATSNCVAVIIDCCNSGGFTNSSIQKSGRVVLTGCRWDENSSGWQGQSSPPPGYWGDFTGNQDAEFGNGTDYGPVGIIGGLFNADDPNRDNWRSAGEIFDFANKTTVEYTTGEFYRPGGGVTKIQHPQQSYGVVDGGIPIVMYDKYSSFLIKTPWGDNYIEPTIFPYNAKSAPLVWPSGPLGRWGMLGNGPSRISYSPSNGPAQSGLLWNRTSLGSVRSSAAVSSKIVFLGSGNGTLYAVDLLTSGTIWKFDSGASVESSPAVADGTVFFGTDSGRVYALDEATGLARWSYETGATVSSPGVCNGTVFVGSYGGGGAGGGRLYALDEMGGYQIWNFSTAGPIVGSPAVSRDTIFIGDYNGMLYALNITDGALKWDYPIGPPMDPIAPIVSTPAVAEPFVYVTSMNGRVYGIDELSGTPVWRYPTNGPITSSPAVDEARGLVIVGSQDAHVYALNRISGAPVWDRILTMIDTSSPAISGNGLVFVGSTNNVFYCLNETSGDPVWGYSTPGPIYSSPALIDEHVITSSYEGTLYCFGPEFPYHDIAVSHVEASPTTVRLGEKVTINYTIRNFGNRAETFNVTIAHNNNTQIWTPPLYLEPVQIHSEELTIQPGQTINLSCEWCTTQVMPGEYMILATIPSLEYESNVLNNVYVIEPIEITIIGGGVGGGGRTPYIR